MILAWNLQKPWQAQKNKKCTKHWQAPKKTKNPATTPKWTHSSGKKIVFFVVFGACAGLVTLTSQTLTNTKQNKNKPLDAPNIDRHQKKQKNKKIQQLLKSGPIVAGIVIFLFVWCLRRFGACSGLFFFVFSWVPVQVWWLWLHKTLTGTNKKQTTRCTKHRQAPQKQKKIQQLLRSGPIVPGNFCVFVFFGASAGLATLTSQNIDRHQKSQNKTVDAPNIDRHQKKQKTKIQQLLRSGPIVLGNSSFFLLVPLQVWCI